MLALLRCFPTFETTAVPSHLTPLSRPPFIIAPNTCSGSLNQDVVDWAAAQGCYSELDRRSFLALLPAHARNTMPDQGDSVLYYGDGHALSIAAEVGTSECGVVRCGG